jgi:hypothetical protein
MVESLKTRIHREVVHTKEIEHVPAQEATDAIMKLINMTLIQGKLETVQLSINQLEQAVKNHPSAREGLNKREGERDLLLELQKIVNEPQE